MLYFFDDSTICAVEGFSRVPGPVEKLGPVLRPDRVSDGRRCMSFASSVVPLGDGTWRMYYSVSHFTANMRGIAVAESEDGLRWEKPGLGQLRMEDGDTNRLVYAFRDVLIVTDPPVFQRRKLWAVSPSHRCQRRMILHPRLRLSGAGYSPRYPCLSS